MIRFIMTPELSYLRNDAITYFTCSKIVHGSFFLQYPPRLSWSLSEIYVSVIEIFWNEVFMVWNVVKSGQSWRSTVMEPGLYLWKRSAIPTHSCFNLFFKKESVKDHGDSFSWLLVRKKDLISIYWGALVSGFSNILFYFNKKIINK